MKPFRFLRPKRASFKDDEDHQRPDVQRALHGWRAAQCDGLPSAGGRMGPPGAANAGEELGFSRAHQNSTSSPQDSMVRFATFSNGAGAEIFDLPHSLGLTLDAVYAHDSSLPTTLA